VIVGTLGLVRANTVRDVAGRLQASWHQDALAALHGLSDDELDLLVRLERGLRGASATTRPNLAEKGTR
jgi:hypothetical protein